MASSHADSELAKLFLKTGTEILGIKASTSRSTAILDAYRHNFKYSPSRCAFLFLRIESHPFRRLCSIFKADRKTIRKYTWPTISAIASLADDYVSSMAKRQLFRVHIV